MIYTIEQISDIIKQNPAKKRLDAAREQRKLFSRHVLGYDFADGIKNNDWFENKEVAKVKKAGAISNKDFFARLLKEEKQVFTTRGGSARFNLSEKQEEEFNALLANIRYGMPLRKWTERIAWVASNVDPMGVVFMEVEQMKGKTSPKCYPTYKSTENIHDYLPVGRDLEYICFKITPDEYKTYGIPTEPGNTPMGVASKYYRWVDESQDVIVMSSGDGYIQATGLTQPARIVNTWGRVPGFILSDLMSFDDPQKFLSRLDEVIELAECYLNDRADRNLQKKFHGFAKAVEPLLKCSSCKEGHKRGVECPDCKGTGYKLITKVADVAKFPLEILKDVSSFDFKKIFGYVTPPIETWDKQDSSLSDLDALTYYTYWGVVNMKMMGFNGKNLDETATKTLSDLQPKYSRLNETADWGESTDNKIADFAGQFYYKGAWKGANIRYGRNYILESVEDIAGYYYEMCKSNAPDSLKDEALTRYIRALYQANPMMQAKYIKLMKVVPFPHNSHEQVESSEYIPTIDKLMKRFGGEWEDTLQDGYITLPENTVEKLRGELRKYAEGKAKELEQEPKEEETEVTNNQK